jgi:putative ABC transport system permease protein
MRLALTELRRRPGRFALAGTVLTLIAILLIFLGGLLDGLTAGSTGALRAQSADLFVFSSNSRDSIVRSRIDPEVRREVEAVDGVARADGLGSVQLGARVPGKGPRDLVPMVLFGYASSPPSFPGPPPPFGQAWADEVLRSDGVRVGSTVRLGPARTPVEVTGFVDDSRYNGQGTLWGSLATWRRVQDANRPEARLGPGTVQVLVVEGADGTEPAALATRIDRASGGATSSLTLDEAIAALPGVSAQEATFNQIIGLTVVIAILVVALFFALITVERIGLYGVLKALGASSTRLFAGVLAQAVLITLVASVIAAVAGLALAAVIPEGSVPFQLSAGRLGFSVVFLLVAAVIGSAFSLRRVLKVDPAIAIGGDR